MGEKFVTSACNTQSIARLSEKIHKIINSCFQTGIHPKKQSFWRLCLRKFFGFSAKFQAENAKSILHPSHRLRQHHLRWRQHHLRWKQHHLRWRQHHFRWKQHHFLSIFTIFYRFSRFTHFCRDLHFVAIYALFPQIFFGQNSHLRNITRFLHVWRQLNYISLVGFFHQQLSIYTIYVAGLRPPRFSFDFFILTA